MAATNNDERNRMKTDSPDIPLNELAETGDPASLICPLCQAANSRWWHRRKHRDYWCCVECHLVFVAAHQQVSAAAEKSEYDKHQNNTEDPGYRKFLTRPWQAVCDRVPAGSSGLDFGCGPGPALASMLEEAGYSVDLYDLFYYPDTSVLARRHRFICLTEVIEHLASPAEVLPKLWRQLEACGWLIIQTQRVRDREAFARWRYVDDPTHIAFYSEATFAWLAEYLGAKHWEVADRDVVVLKK